MSKHISAPETIAGEYLKPLGWVRVSDTFFPTYYEFRDAEGTIFYAKPDFYHPILKAYIEVKDSSLNGVKTKAGSDRQKLGESYAPNKLYFQLKNGWNHSAHKQVIVQQAISASKFMVVFTGKVDDKNVKRIKNAGLHAYSIANLERWLFQLRIRHSLTA